MELPVTMGLFHAKTIWQVADLLNGAGVQQDLNDVESDFNLGIFQEPQIVQASTSESPAALFVHSSRGARPFFRRACFDLNEHEAVLIAENKVNFASRGSEVGGQELETKLFQMPLCGSLAQ